MSRKYLLFCLYLFSQIVCSQEYLPVERFTKENGLSHNHVTAIHLDKEGYLWIGTLDGLNRFDGYSFDVFGANIFRENSLPQAKILKIFEDSEKRLWIITPAGISKYDATDNSFRSFFLPAVTASDTISRCIRDAAYNWKQNFILILAEDGLYSFDLATGEIRKKEIHPIPEELVCAQRSLVYNGLRNYFYLFSDYAVLKYEVDRDSTYALPPDNVSGLRIDGGTLGITCDVRGASWLYSRQRIWNLNNETGSCRQVFRIDDPEAQIISIFQEHQDELLVATTTSLISLNTTTGEQQVFQKYRAQLDQDDEITQFLLMKNGVFWLGTTEGLLQFNIHRFCFKNFNFSELFTRDEAIHDIVFGKDGSVWIVSESGEVVLYNVAGFADNDILARRRSVRGPGTLKYLANTDTVIMSTGDGLYLLRKKDGRIDSREIYRGQHYSFCLSRRDTVWVIGEKTLTDFSLRKNLPVHTRTLEIDLKGEVLDMFEMNGSLYILQPYQIIVHGLKNSSDQILSLRNLKLKALPENTCFLPLDSRELILGTDIGLFVFYLYDSKILPTYIDTEPLSTRICALEKDISKHIWVATESSLYSLNKAENTIKSYTRFEGLHWPEHGPIKVSKSPGGFICFAGESEAVTFHPDLLDFNRPPPAIKIKELSLLTRKSSQHMSMLEADTIRVNNRYTLMQFTCNLLDYWDPHNNKYEYSLVKSGKPDYWVDLGTHNSFTISRLRPGIYSLKVRGLNSSNTWTEEPRELVIDVVAPIWRTKIAILVYAIVVFLMFYFSIFFTTRQLRKLNREYREREQIARKVEQQKEELTQKNKNITDSLNYAKRIQMALLPSQKLFSKFFSESFILHIPKDIVSGDFYWINEVDGRIYFAAVDCTGHGVPGAFMSIIGFELFRRITEQEKKKRPAEILNSLSQGFESIFRDIENITLRDGMDVAFCAIDPKMKVLEFAGAFNPLYLIRDNTISEIKGDRFSVGLNQSDEGFPGQEFQDHVIQLREGDVIYIFTDGYADQFGGPEGKKYKYRRFRHLLLALHQLPMERQVEFLRRSIMDWKGDIDQVDDILVMGIRVHQRE